MCRGRGRPGKDACVGECAGCREYEIKRTARHRTAHGRTSQRAEHHAQKRERCVAIGTLGNERNYHCKRSADRFARQIDRDTQAKTNVAVEAHHRCPYRRGRFRDPQIKNHMNQEIEQAIHELRANAARYAKPERYYRGDHDLAFATEKFQNAFGSMFREFALNLCPAVCDAVRDKLKITGFGIESAETGPPQGQAAFSSLHAAAGRIWGENRMSVRSGDVHKEALKNGDAYVIVWPDGSGRRRDLSEPHRKHRGLLQRALARSHPPCGEILAACRQACLSYPLLSRPHREIYFRVRKRIDAA